MNFNNFIGFYLSECKLGEMLAKLYDSNSYQKVLSIHLFGIIFGEYIRKEKLSTNEILNYSKLPQSYLTELNKGVNLSSYVEVKNEDIAKISDIIKR